MNMIKINTSTLVIGSFLLLFSIMSTTSAETLYKVKSTDNLNRIIDTFYQESNLTRSQLLVGVLAKNQSAFRGGNINFLLRGKKLVLPDLADIETLSDQEAKEVLADHSRYFRRGESGNFGSPIASGYLVSKSQKKTNIVEDKHVLQAVKVDQLEKESEDLRKRLEKLISEKNESDEKLRKVEQDLQEALNHAAKDKKGGQLNSLESAQDKKKQNDQLKEKIDSFQHINTQKSTVVNTTKNQSSVDEGGLKSDKSVIGKYMLPILILSLLLLGWFFWSKNKKNKFIEKEDNIQTDVEQAYLGDKDFLSQQSDEEPSRNTIKFDMAQAYIDSGDIQSATNILNNLINEGSSTQRKQAQELLNTLN